MGNVLCCPPAKLCDHTVDEVQGLLKSSESKASAKAEGNEEGAISPLPAVKESIKNEEHVTQEKDGFTTQPMASSKSSGSHVPQSSYSAIIPILHTEVSLSAQLNQSASPMSKAPEQLVEAAVIAIEDAGTKNGDGNSQTLATKVSDAPGKEPAVFSTAVAIEKTEAQITDDLIEKGEAAKTVQGASTEVPAEEANMGEGTHKEIVEIVKEMDTKQKVLEEDIEKEEEPKTPAEVLDEKHITRNEESTLDTATIDKPEAKGILPAAETAQTSSDTLVTENGIVEPQVSSAHVDFVEKTPAQEVISEEPISKIADKVDELREESSEITEVKGDLPSETQEPSEQVPSPLMKESTAHKIENGEVDDMGDLKDEMSLDVADVPKEAAISLRTCEEPPLTKTEDELWLAEVNSGASPAETVEKPDSTVTSEAQKTITECMGNEGQTAEALLNGLESAAPVEKPESTDTSVAKADDKESEIKATDPSTAVLLDDNQKKDESEPAPQPSENEQEATRTEEKEDSGSHQAHKGEIILSSSVATKISLIPVNEIENVAEKEQVQDDEDLYRGDDEIEKGLPKETQPKPLLEFTLPGVEKCSLAPPVDILAYSEREWKGNTAKSTLIRKGYSEMSCSFTGLRRVRGDNYCSLRATLYQVLATTDHTPAWLLEEDFTSLPEKLAAQEDLIETWVFPPECDKAEEKMDAVEKLKHYTELLQKKWQEAAESESFEDKQLICESIFQGGEEEYGLLEVLKLLMLAKAVELHEKMQEGQEVPVFCWLLFARDTSENPRMFFSNHLSQMGFSGGLEQVEMFLLGYALQHTIQAFRLYKIDTEEFVTHYPDDHKQDWPCVCIVTEDDRHYNIPVRKQAQYRE